MPWYLPAVLLFSCWIASLAILLIFLESWFGVSDRNRFVARRASGAYGICTIFVNMRGSAEDTLRTARSIFNQSYPFAELLLIYPQDDTLQAALAKELRASRSHVAVRLVPVAHGLDAPADRVRGLEFAQPMARGRWYALIEPGIVLDRLAIESALEFAGSGEVRALALSPGTRASSTIHRLLTPSVEYFYQLLRIIERRRARRTAPPIVEEPFLLLNREAFDVVHRINRMPGILNEAGWSRWSYQVEGLRTFDGDGANWLWRETVLSTLPNFSSVDPKVAGRAPFAIIAAAVMSCIPVVGLVYGFRVPAETFPEAMILALSAVSYTLMTIGYFLCARKLHAAAWFAPFWFLIQPAAAIVAIMGLQRSAAGRISTSLESETGKSAAGNRRH